MERDRPARHRTLTAASLALHVESRPTRHGTLTATVFDLRVRHLPLGNAELRKCMGDPGLEPGASALSERRSNRLS
jgi:hypothetical protein